MKVIIRSNWNERNYEIHGENHWPPEVLFQRCVLICEKAYWRCKYVVKVVLDLGARQCDTHRRLPTPGIYVEVKL